MDSRRYLIPVVSPTYWSRRASFLASPGPTQHIKGTVGLKSGSQAPPGVYFIAPLLYVYKTDEVSPPRPPSRFMTLPTFVSLSSFFD
jgi:hypothetical protein